MIVKIELETPHIFFFSIFSANKQNRVLKKLVRLMIAKKGIIKEFKRLPCSLWLTGRVHEEECDESFSVNRLKTRNCVRFL